MARLAKPDGMSRSGLVHYVAFFVGALCLVGLASIALHKLLPVLRVLVPGLVGWWLWQRHCKVERRRQKHLHTTFYQLLREHHGQITLLDFAMTAEITAIAARHYLDSRAKEFAARFEVTEHSDVVYVFSSLQLSRSPSASIPVVDTVAGDHTGVAALPNSLTQTELAKRLGVAAKTISRKKHLPLLSDWTQTRDPDGVGWSYAAQTQRFLPIIDRLVAQAEKAP
ncbi:hypothetical protein H6F86_07470 [Phormidium sp. FACHB-592]|uniref:HTH cro/C1-type domain-containing protein n=1 Tax=Stenomitos frigidus AS-A4 TaxID=2933935 RepID=A0ABV0KJ71_9CYAN|nr:hypothetical protein [Phormidium sp. FACHB-592]MBD2073730.1 hypothetical protein [Phormidium sp. FACHB-592]